MNLGEMRRLLEARGIRLTKSLGQNFLHDSNQIRRIADAGEVSAGDQVLEIGPGLGPLTSELLDRARLVRAIELDQRLADFLQERFASRSNFELMHADALEVIRDHSTDWSDWKLVSNLPYSVGSPILVEFALQRQAPLRMVATLQLEVVERLSARPDSDSYGILSLLIGLRYTVAGSFKIPASCFFPPPDVTSACVTLIRRITPLMPAELEAVYVRLVKLAFSQRRKMMKKLLKAAWPAKDLDAAFERVGISAAARAEQLGITQFVALAQNLVHGKEVENE